jgi:hypothetical protein
MMVLALREQIFAFAKSHPLSLTSALFPAGTTTAVRAKFLFALVELAEIIPHRIVIVKRARNLNALRHLGWRGVSHHPDLMNHHAFLNRPLCRVIGHCRRGDQDQSKRENCGVSHGVSFHGFGFDRRSGLIWCSEYLLGALPFQDAIAVRLSESMLMIFTSQHPRRRIFVFPIFVMWQSSLPASSRTIPRYIVTSDVLV